MRIQRHESAHTKRRSRPIVIKLIKETYIDGITVRTYSSERGFIVFDEQRSSVTVKSSSVHALTHTTFFLEL